MLISSTRSSAIAPIVAGHPRLRQHRRSAFCGSGSADAVFGFNLFAALLSHLCKMDSNNKETIRKQWKTAAWRERTCDHTPVGTAFGTIPMHEKENRRHPLIHRRDFSPRGRHPFYDSWNQHREHKRRLCLFGKRSELQRKS